MILLPASGRTESRWRNGAGSTTEVVSAGGADFDWRISIARVDGASDFSFFPGVDRMLMPLSPEGLDLEVDGAHRHLALGEVLPFAGEQVVRSLGSGSTEDLNLMVRRGVVSGSLEWIAVDGSLRVVAGEGTVVVIALSGTVAGLARHDALRLGAGEQATLTGSGSVAVARVR